MDEKKADHRYVLYIVIKHPSSFSPMTYYWISAKTYTTGATSRSGTAYPRYLEQFVFVSFLCSHISSIALLFVLLFRPFYWLRVSSSWSTSGTRRVSLGRNPVISHGGKGGWMFYYDIQNISVVICYPYIPYLQIKS
jgi:hypothetical protein